MPRRDPPPTGRAVRGGGGDWASPYPRLPRRKRRPKGGEPEREPVAPDKPRPLAGGAAAELEFDD